jgi:hypothetical protein
MEEIKIIEREGEPDIVRFKPKIEQIRGQCVSIQHDML